MRQARLIREDGDAFYHCMSRVVDCQFIFKKKWALILPGMSLL